jgi:hypothetical protein
VGKMVSVHFIGFLPGRPRGRPRLRA